MIHEKAPHSSKDACGHLPEGWETRRLSSLTKSYSGGTPDRSRTEYFGGTIPWVKSGEVNNRRIFKTEEFITNDALKNSSAKLVEMGAILVAMYGATAGKIAQLKIDAAINQAILSIRSNGGELDNNFLFWVLESKAEKLLTMCQGAAQPNLSKGLIDGLTIAKPPINEQRRIAEILTLVDDKLDVITRQIAATQTLKQGLMRTLFSRGVGTQDVNGRWLPHTEFKDSELGEIPVTWQRLSLEKFCDGVLKTGPFGSQLHAAEYQDEGVSVVMPKDLINYRVDKKRAAKITSERAEILVKHKLVKGDILFSRRGDVARFALIDEASEGAICGTGCLKAKPSKEHSSAYLSHLLQLDSVKEWLEQNAVGQTMPNMNTSILASLPLIAPPSLAEEEEIAGILDCLDKKMNILVTKQTHYQTLKRGLMQKLLTGEWRVKVEESGSEDL